MKQPFIHIAVLLLILAAQANAQSTALPPLRIEPSQNGRTARIATNASLNRTINSERWQQLHVDGPMNRHHVRTNLIQVPNDNTIPTWTDSFRYQGLEFTYRMVGTDPNKGSETTTIPTEIIPLRFVFPNGSVYDPSTDPIDGSTAIQRILDSPIFHNYNFVIGGTSVGNTQYGDAFQRANFWNLVSTRSPNYHVLLGQPSVLAAQTIIVPPDKDLSFISPVTGQIVPKVDDEYLLDIQESVIRQLNISPKSLPILVWGVITTQFAAAEHLDVSTTGGTVTYIGTSFHSSGNGFFNFGGDIYPLSHEIVEWLDDPLLSSTPGWNFAFDPPSARCASSISDLLEVADPVEFLRESEILLTTPSGNYHVTDAVFIDFFTRASRSRSVNGQYDFFGIHRSNGAAVSVAPDCVGDLHPVPQIVDVPGSIATEAYGVNNKSDVVGLYANADRRPHGFQRMNGRFITIDFPGAVATGAIGMNDAGATVGYFYDSNLNLHGFLYRNGRFQPLDFPGSSNTVARGINSAGDIVGLYDVATATVHGFILRNGQFQTIDTPFGTNSQVLGINDLGELVGNSWTPFGPEGFGFIFGPHGFIELNMAGSIVTEIDGINNSGMKAGNFVDGTYFYGGAFIDLFGYQHEVNFPIGDPVGILYVLPFVNGNNDLNQIVGITLDPDSFKEVGFISTLPIAGR